ncbi:hypothetical protein [Streptomyces olivaceus]|nr:hypothetical protein [Streptomyces olivaceus]
MTELEEKIIRRKAPSSDNEHDKQNRAERMVRSAKTWHYLGLGK